jgi:hypothetical protein
MVDKRIPCDVIFEEAARRGVHSTGVVKGKEIELR